MTRAASYNSLPMARTDRRRYLAENPGGGLCGSAFDTTAAATNYRCQPTSSYQVTCTACSPATVSIIASVSALAGRPG
jgi:hypothetical protein